jgi:hypothetical protein
MLRRSSRRVWLWCRGKRGVCCLRAVLVVLLLSVISLFQRAFLLTDLCLWQLLCVCILPLAASEVMPSAPAIHLQGPASCL